MKLLSIGNSFSQDAHRYLHKLAIKAGFDLETVNLFYGGCSLQQHWEFYEQDLAELYIHFNGGAFERKVSLKEALEADTYDVITLQQASPSSGVPKTYFPYLQKLADLVKEKQPNAKIYFHQTWAYEKGAEHGGFLKYDKNQYEMYRRIIDASEMASVVINAPIIPCGKVIQTLRDTVKEFDFDNGGLSLNRDGFHLSLDYGRFAAAATFLRVLSEQPIKIDKFDHFDTEANDFSIVSKILDVVEDVCK